MELKWKAAPVAKKPRVISSSTLLGEKEQAVKDEKERILVIENSLIHTDRKEDEKKPLVIPLLPSKPVTKDAHSDSKAVIESKNDGDSLDQQAEQELIDGDDRTKKSNLVIRSSSSVPVKEEEHVQRSLLQSLIERQRELKQHGDNKLHLEAHADDLDFRSDVFEAIPVEEFGAALLRGMGWTGEKSEAEKKLEQRQKRLGLGAAPLPIPGKKGQMLPPTANAQNSISTSNSANSNTLDGRIVTIQDEKLLGKRAVVRQARGVPGLNMIRVEIEKTGEMVDIGRKHAVVVSEQELLANPFDYAKPVTGGKQEGEGKGEMLEYDANADFAVVKKEGLPGLEVREGAGLKEGGMGGEPGGRREEEEKGVSGGRRTSSEGIDGRDWKDEKGGYARDSRGKSRSRDRYREGDRKRHEEGDYNRYKKDSRDRDDRKDTKKREREERDRSRSRDKKDRYGDRDREKDKDRGRNRSRSRERESKKSKRDRSYDRDDRDKRHEKDRRSADESSHGRREERDYKKDTAHDVSKHSQPSSATVSSRPAVSWLRAGLLVKIISKKLPPEAYLQKATIVDVYSLGVCSVRMQKTGKVIEEVKDTYLETVVPAVGGACMVLTGEYTGEIGRVVERDDSNQTVTVELADSLEIVILSMDDLSAFSS